MIPYLIFEKLDSPFTKQKYTIQKSQCANYIEIRQYIVSNIDQLKRTIMNFQRLYRQ